jgi:signal peptidase I
MIDTLLIGDRIFVNKVIYGPELLPGLAKLPSPVRPKRDEVIIFENPSYISRGPAFDVAQRILYMLTLSIVDIDRDESGEPKPHFLIKRAVGMGGDLFTSKNGEMRIRFAGEDRWVDERDFNAGRGYKHRISRLVYDDSYPVLEAVGKASACISMNIIPPDELWEAAAKRTGISYTEYVNQLRRQQNQQDTWWFAASQIGGIQYADTLALEKSWMELRRGASPQESRYSMLLARHYLGWYVPEGRILPLGDNRDNSRDGRFFGPVKESKILGKGAVKYWPYWRIGPIR